MGPIRRPRPQTPRHLMHKHVRRLFRIGQAEEDTSLQTGYQQLRSFVIPGLQAGPHIISITQSIQTLPDKSKDKQGKYLGEKRELKTTQKFEAVAARFTLPDNSIHSVYPPQGHDAKPQLLPHVVFNDPTFPWEREGPLSESHDRRALMDRSRTPWLAVFAFTEDELKLDDETLRQILKIDSPAKPPVSPTLSTSVALQQMGSFIPAMAPVLPKLGADDQGSADMVFLTKELFIGLFTKYNDKGKPDSAWAGRPYVYHHALLGHRRDINSQGMTVPAGTTEDDSGSFGVMFSHRTGPYSITKPTVMYVHMVSMEGVDSINPWPLVGPTFVFLRNAPDVEQEFENLGANINVLRPPCPGENEKISSTRAPDTAPDPARDMVISRIKNGYSLSRYRTHTGEVTVCLTQVPFVPTDLEKFQDPPDWWKVTSMSRTDLQILDRDLGIMDITYSAAWQLDRTMAIADQAYTSAFFRVRGEILARATSSAHEKYSMQQKKTFKSKIDLLRSLSDTIDQLSTVPDRTKLLEKGGMQRRWLKPATEALDLSYQSIGVQENLDAAIQKVAREVASTPTANDPTQPDEYKPYNEYKYSFLG